MICTQCGENPKYGHQNICSVCNNKNRRDKYHSSPAYKRNRRSLASKYKYGLDFDEIDKIVRNQDGCAICHTMTPGGNGNWHVDHDHACCDSVKTCGNCIRGILCALCNSGLGYFRDRIDLLREASNYLERGPAG